MAYDKLPSGETKVGFVSQHFERLFGISKMGIPLPTLRVFFRESSFVLPSESDVPVTMIGPGCGVAPFRAFLQEKQCLSLKNEMSLYFGCRHSCKDYLYKEEFQNFCENGTLNNYSTAFSREGDQVVYVQDKLEENMDKVLEDLLEKNGVIFMCGSLRMGKSVTEKISNAIASKLSLDENGLYQKMKELEKGKQIIKELWG